jgi:hypothetical protein
VSAIAWLLAAGCVTGACFGHAVQGLIEAAVLIGVVCLIGWVERCERQS